MTQAERCVIVRVDKTTGDYFVSPEMLRHYYDLYDATQLCDRLRTQMGELCDFFIIPYYSVFTLINAELNLKAKYEENPNDKTIIN